VDTAPKASGCIPGGNQGFTGRNRESRSREAAGRRNYPEAVPKERSGRNRRHIKPSVNAATSTNTGMMMWNYSVWESKERSRLR